MNVNVNVSARQKKEGEYRDIAINAVISGRSVGKCKKTQRGKNSTDGSAVYRRNVSLFTLSLSLFHSKEIDLEKRGEQFEGFNFQELFFKGEKSFARSFPFFLLSLRFSK